MYVAAGGVLLLYLLLGILSRKETVEETEQTLLLPFRKMGMFLYKRACMRKLPLFSGRQVARDLERLHPGENVERLCARYYVKKLSFSLLLLFVGTLFSLAFFVKEQGERLLDDSGSVLRGSYQEPEKELEVTAFAGGEETFHILVQPQTLSEPQIRDLYRAFWERLPEVIAGRNPSLLEVTEDLELVDSLEGYPFAIQWESERPEFVSSEGKVASVEESVDTVLRAAVSYGEWERLEEISLRLVPQLLSPEEQRRRELEALITRSEAESRAEAVWTLPQVFEGRQILWTEKLRDHSLPLWGMAAGVAVLTFFLADKDLHDDLEKRKRRLKRDYPDLVQKLALYLGAGMTVRGAFVKIAAEYEQGGQKRTGEGCVYEEMRYTCRELQAGISEGAAYEHFGRRTGLQEYIRLSTLLQQNLKKGSSTLLSRLREEADKALAERIQNSRRMGEEAVTKLLLPMVMMLLVVMIMIMLPAFSAVV